MMLIFAWCDRCRYDRLALLFCLLVLSAPAFGVGTQALARYIRMTGDRSRYEHFVKTVVLGPCFERSRMHPKFSATQVFERLDGFMVRGFGANTTYYRPCLESARKTPDTDIVRRFIDTSVLRYLDTLDSAESQKASNRVLLRGIKQGDFAPGDLKYILTGAEECSESRIEQELIDELNRVLASTIQAYEERTWPISREVVSACLTVLIGMAAVVCLVVQLPHFHCE